MPFDILTSKLYLSFHYAKVVIQGTPGQAAADTRARLAQNT